MANKGMLSFIKTYYGLIAISVAFLGSALAVYLNTQGHATMSSHVVKTGETLKSIAADYSVTVREICDANYPDVNEGDVLKPGTRLVLPGSARSKLTTIMIVHWQLEPGCRDGIDYMAREYEKLHPNVRIVQNAMPSATYGQWFVTQMVGGNPPDLIEIGLGVPQNLLIQYYVRYFNTLTEHVSQPNPYNKGNEFENVPLKDTMKDGLRAAYNMEIQEYMTMPLTIFMVRVFYNKSLLKNLTGMTSAPRDWREFIAVSDTIRKQKFIRTPDRKRIAALRKQIEDAKNAKQVIAGFEKEIADIEEKSPNYVPLAATGGYFPMNAQYFAGPVTTKARYDVDFNRDGYVGGDEQYFASRLGRISMNSGPYRAYFSMLSNMTQSCVLEGFIGLQYDDGVLMFVQQRSVFYAMGTWEAQLMEKYSKENGFELGVMDFPIPSKDDPEYGKFVEGQAFEAAGLGFQFGCPTPQSAPERKKAAIDFLLFLASKDNNARLNDTIGWIPAVRNTPMRGIFRDFIPHDDGVPHGMAYNGFGGEVIIKWQQLYALFLTGQITYDKLAAEFEPFYLKQSAKDVVNWYENGKAALANIDNALAVLRARAFASTNREAYESLIAKYRFAARRVVAVGSFAGSVGLNKTRMWLEELETNNNVSRFNPEYGPYEFTPEAKRRIEGR